MKTRLVLYCYILLGIFSYSSNVYGQGTQWVTGGGAAYGTPLGYNAHETVWETAVDDNGNLYVLAEFMASGSITIDTITFPIRSDVSSMFRSRIGLLSYNSEGHIRWGKIIEGRDNVNFAALVYSKGQIYISGAAVDASGAEKRYFGNDTAMSANYYGSWLIKYDTSGSFKWIRAQAENTIPSFTVTANNYSKLLVQDTFIHCIKYIYGSGAKLTPTVLSKRGIYDYTYTPQGDLVSLIRLPLADSMLSVSLAEPSTIYGPSNTLYLSVIPQESYNGSGVAVFDADRNLIRYDTFTTTGIPYGGVASTFRSGDALYTFGTYFGSDCTFRGETYSYAFAPKTGRFGFVIKTDTNYNLIWKKQLNSATRTDVNLSTWYGGLNKGRIILTGFANSIVIGSDTMIMPGTTGKVPLVILDSSGNVDKLDFWYNNNATGGIEAGNVVNCYKDNIYVAGMVLDSMWGNTSGYRSHGGQTDFFVAKYSYGCTAPKAAFTVSTAGDSVQVIYSGTTADSIGWDFGAGPSVSGNTASYKYSLPGIYTICVIAYRDCGNDTSCQSVKVTGGGMGISGPDLAGAVHIYPNPATETITIENAAIGTTMKLCDVTGRSLYTISVRQQKENIHVGNLEPGLYILSALNNGQQSAVWRFIKR